MLKLYYWQSFEFVIVPELPLTFVQLLPTQVPCVTKLNPLKNGCFLNTILKLPPVTQFTAVSVVPSPLTALKVNVPLPPPIVIPFLLFVEVLNSAPYLTVSLLITVDGPLIIVKISDVTVPKWFPVRVTVPEPVIPLQPVNVRFTVLFVVTVAEPLTQYVPLLVRV